MARVGDAYVNYCGTKRKYPMLFKRLRNRFGVPLQRWVWEQHHGDIPTAYIIHHIDGDFRNNKIENLRMLDRQTHLRIHFGWLFLDDGSWIKRCKTCLRYKAPEEYHKNSDSYQNSCKECKSREGSRNPKIKAYRQEYEKRDYVKAHRKAYRQTEEAKKLRRDRRKRRSK